MPDHARVVVSGGAGFIGSHIVERLHARGWQVLVVDDHTHPCGVPPPSGVEVVVADCGSSEAAARIAGFRPTAALNLAAKGGVSRALRDPAGHVRVVLASTVAFYSAAVAAGARSIVSASSGGAVYGDAQVFPTPEDAPPAPRSAYGAEKLAEEVYLGSFGRTGGVRTLALRYANVYGPRQDGTGEAGVVAITCWRLLGGHPPLVHGDGGQSRDFTYVGDVADATVAAIESDASGALNVGTGVSTTVDTVVATLCRAAGYGGDVLHDEAKPGEVRRGCIDPRRAEDALGWRARMALEAGLRETHRWFRDAAASPAEGSVAGAAGSGAEQPDPQPDQVANRAGDGARTRA